MLFLPPLRNSGIHVDIYLHNMARRILWLTTIAIMIMTDRWVLVSGNDLAYHDFLVNTAVQSSRQPRQPPCLTLVSTYMGFLQNEGFCWGCPRDWVVNLHGAWEKMYFYLVQLIASMYRRLNSATLHEPSAASGCFAPSETTCTPPRNVVTAVLPWTIWKFYVDKVVNDMYR